MKDVVTFVRELKKETALKKEFQERQRIDYICPARSITLPDNIEDYESYLSQQGAGGVVMTVVEKTKDREIAIRIVPGVLYAPPQNFLRLEAGEKPAWASIESRFTIAKDAHIMFPVDKKAEERLLEFHKMLTQLTPDLERLILHAIREPLLETRVALLEERTKQKADPQPATNARSMKPPVAVVVMLGVLLALLFVFAVGDFITANNRHNALLHQLAAQTETLNEIKQTNERSLELLTKLSQPVVEPSKKESEKNAKAQKPAQEKNLPAQPTEPEQEPKNPIDNAAVADFDNAAKLFLKTLQKKKDADESLNLLWNSHLKGISDVDKLSPDELMEKVQSEGFVWSVAKVWLSRNSTEPLKEALFQKNMNYKEIKEAFVNALTDKDKRFWESFPETDSDLLAELACQIKHKTYQSLPGIPDGEPFLFANENEYQDSKKCPKPIDKAKATPGLIKLTEQLEGLN